MTTQAPVGMRYSPLAGKYVKASVAPVQRFNGEEIPFTSVPLGKEVVEEMSVTKKVIWIVSAIFLIYSIFPSTSKPVTNAVTSPAIASYDVPEMEKAATLMGTLVGAAVACSIDTENATDSYKRKFKNRFGIDFRDAPLSVVTAFTQGTALGVSIVSKDTSPTKCDTARKSLG